MMASSDAFRQPTKSPRWQPVVEMFAGLAAIALTALPLRALAVSLGRQGFPGGGLSPAVARHVVTVASGLAEVAVAWAALWLFYRMTRAGSWAALGFGSGGARWLALGLAAPLAALALVLAAGKSAGLLPASGLVYPGPWPVALAFAAATRAAWLEELIFRGVLLQGIARIWNRGAAVVVTTILFTLAHLAAPFRLTPAWWALVALGGTGLGWTAAMTRGRLWLALGLHWGFALWAYLAFGLPGVTRGVLRWEGNTSAAALTPQAGWALLVAAALTALAVIALVKRTER